MPWSPKKASRYIAITNNRVLLAINARIYVAGHRGLVGSAIVRALQNRGYRNLILRSRVELDLTQQSAVRNFFEQERPEAVIMAAARVGGIYANNGGSVNYGSNPYSHTTALFDITSGTNGSCTGKPSYFCHAKTGYDGPTGLGTPNGNTAF